MNANLTDKKQKVSYLPFRGLWEGTNNNNEKQIFFSQNEAEKFAGVEYNSELDAKYWQDNFPQHFN